MLAAESHRTVSAMPHHIFTRRDLYDRVWTEPIRTAALSLGVSDVGLAKACRVAGVPVPPRGYWAKLQHGKPTPPRAPLRSGGADRHGERRNPGLHPLRAEQGRAPRRHRRGTTLAARAADGARDGSRRRSGLQNPRASVGSDRIQRAQNAIGGATAGHRRQPGGGPHRAGRAARPRRRRPARSAWPIARRKRRCRRGSSPRPSAIRRRRRSAPMSRRRTARRRPPRRTTPAGGAGPWTRPRRWIRYGTAQRRSRGCRLWRTGRRPADAGGDEPSASNRSYSTSGAVPRRAIPRGRRPLSGPS